MRSKVSIVGLSAAGVSVALPLLGILLAMIRIAERSPGPAVLKEEHDRVSLVLGAITLGSWVFGLPGLVLGIVAATRKKSGDWQPALTIALAAIGLVVSLSCGCAGVFINGFNFRT